MKTGNTLINVFYTLHLFPHTTLFFLTSNVHLDKGSFLSSTADSKLDKLHLKLEQYRGDRKSRRKLSRYFPVQYSVQRFNNSVEKIEQIQYKKNYRHRTR